MADTIQETAARRLAEMDKAMMDPAKMRARAAELEATMTPNQRHRFDQLGSALSQHWDRHDELYGGDEGKWPEGVGEKAYRESAGIEDMLAGPDLDKFNELSQLQAYLSKHDRPAAQPMGDFSLGDSWSLAPAHPAPLAAKLGQSRSKQIIPDITKRNIAKPQHIDIQRLAAKRVADRLAAPAPDAPPFIPAVKPKPSQAVTLPGDVDPTDDQGARR